VECFTSFFFLYKNKVSVEADWETTEEYAAEDGRIVLKICTEEE